MGILLNATVIAVGSFIGSLLKNRITSKYNTVFAFCIIILSVIGFFERVFSIKNGALISENVIILIIILLLGYILGEAIHINGRINRLSERKNVQLKNGFLEASLFFAVGGMQITGAILLAIEGDNSILFQKCIIDLPFAILFGSAFGKRVIFSALPVALIQTVIFLIAKLFSQSIDATFLNELCALGYTLLFFSGYNMLVPEGKDVKTLNMLPAFVILILYNLIVSLTR